MSDSKLAEIERLLDDERSALVIGDLAALSDIVDRKEELMRALTTDAPARGALAALRAKAERNAELLAAAGKGVRTVIRRVADIRNANGPLKTYGQDGKPQTLGSAPGSLEKRA